MTTESMGICEKRENIMKLRKIIEIADQAYADDGLVLEAFENDGVVGDTLAEFVAREIKETYDPTASREGQLDEAYRVMSVAHEQLENVLTALAIANRKRSSRSAAVRIPRASDKRSERRLQ